MGQLCMCNCFRDKREWRARTLPKEGRPISHFLGGWFRYRVFGIFWVSTAVSSLWARIYFGLNSIRSLMCYIYKCIHLYFTCVRVYTLSIKVYYISLKEGWCTVAYYIFAIYSSYYHVPFHIAQHQHFKSHIKSNKKLYENKCLNDEWK